MAISTTEDEDRTSKFAAVLQGGMQKTAEAPSRRRRGLPRWLTLTSVIVVLLGLGLAAASSSGILTPTDTGHHMLTETAHRANLLVSIAEDGNVESAHNVDIKCEVRGGSTILWIVKDGTVVQQGDELVRMDSSQIEDSINQQKITFEKAKAMKIDSENAYNTAVIAVKEYIEGTFVQSLQNLQANVTVARENLESAKNSLQYTSKMHRKGYVTALQRDAQEFAVQRADLDLKVAETAQTVLEKFNKAKMLASLEAARDSAKAKMASDEAAFELEKARLERFETQLEKCTVKAPDKGMVVYANEMSGRGGGGRGGGGSMRSMVEEGANMIERQTMIKLPDLTRMQVKTTVHESKVDMLRRGMRALIHIQDHNFHGTVTSVANQPEPSDFFSGNVKEYAAIVSIDSDPTGLRPGMTAAVEILIAELKDVLSVPVEAVVEQGGKFYCWVKTSGGSERRPLLVGMSNNTHIEIKDGLKEGDQIIKNPRAIIEEARVDVKVDEKVDVKTKFGDDKPAVLPNVGGPGSQGSGPPAGGYQGAGPQGSGRPSEDRAGGADGEAKSKQSRGGRPGFDMLSLDKDKDGKISLDEAPERMKDNFSNLDTNNDGFIDRKEMAELQKRMQQMRQQGGQQGGQRGGPPGGF